jgi:hypothetical protein
LLKLLKIRNLTPAYILTTSTMKKKIGGDKNIMLKATPIDSEERI